MPLQKTIAVYFTEPGFDDYPFNEAEYRDAYVKMAELLEARGAGFAIVRSPGTYRGGNTFKGGWDFRDGGFRRREGEAAYGVVFSKGRLAFTPDARVINHPELDALCIDKWRTYRTFEALCPRTFLVHDEAGLRGAMERIGGETLVAKPVDAEGGKGVVIAPPETILRSVTTFPYLVQELIDTGGGIPGITPGKHDFRLVAIQGDIVAAFLRIPADGKFVANVSQGGSIRSVPLAMIPAAARAIFTQIDAHFSRFPERIYSVDLGRDRSGAWKIIELNSQPGISIEDYRGSEDGKRFFLQLADLLCESADASRTAQLG